MRVDEWTVVGAVSGAVAVLAGAFGAHGLESLPVAPKALDWWRTASHYHLVHALALLAVAPVARHRNMAHADRAGFGFAAGTVLFSGSLYAMALGAPRWLGAVTPIGGVAWVASWLFLALAARGPAGDT